MEEVEILECETFNEKMFPKNIAIGYIKVVVAQEIINNEVHEITMPAPCLICPTCNTVLQQFNPGTPEVEIIKALNTDDENLVKQHIYCNHCGQCITLMRPAPIEATVEIINKDHE